MKHYTTPKTSTVCIEDKNGKYWNTLCSSDFIAPEIRNMQRHLDLAKLNPDKFKFLDLDTAKILVDGVPYARLSVEDDKLLTELLEA